MNRSVGEYVCIGAREGVVVASIGDKVAVAFGEDDQARIEIFGSHLAAASWRKVDGHCRTGVDPSRVNTVLVARGVAALLACGAGAEFYAQVTHKPPKKRRTR